MIDLEIELRECLVAEIVPFTGMWDDRDSLGKKPNQKKPQTHAFGQQDLLVKTLFFQLHKLL